MNIDLRMEVGKIKLEWPVIPASGVWPYEEDFWRAERLAGIGAVCTKAISLRPRSGNRGIRIWETPAGVLNSIGLQNVGAKGFDKKGNYNLGLVEQSIFPELSFEDTQTLHGLQITFVIKPSNAANSRALLEKFGMPFEKTTEKGAK